MISLDEIYLECEPTFKLIEKSITSFENSLFVLESAFRLLLMLTAKGDNLKLLIKFGIKKVALSGFFVTIKSTEMFIIIIQILRVVYTKFKEEDESVLKETKKIIYEGISENSCYSETALTVGI